MGYNKLENLKKHLKRNLKGKLRITMSLICLFLLNNSLVKADTMNSTEIKRIVDEYLRTKGISNDYNSSNGYLKIGNKINGSDADTISFGINIENQQRSIVFGKNIVNRAQTSIIFGWDNKLIYEKLKYNNFIRLLAIGSDIKGKDSQYSAMLGYKITTNNSNNSTSVGYNNKIENSREGSALGSGIEISGASNSTAIGDNIKIKSKYSIAIGKKTIIDKNSEGAIAIGTDDSAYRNTGKENGDGSYPATKASGVAATAIGAHSQAQKEAATSYGARSFAYEKESLALGANTRAKKEGAIALGAYSLADRDKNNMYYDIFTNKDSNINNKNAQLATKAAVSIGNKNKNITRQLIGLAAGTEDTDAVNVWQLKEVKRYIDTRSISIDADNALKKDWLKLGDTFSIRGTKDGTPSRDGSIPKEEEGWNVGNGKAAIRYTTDNVQTFVKEDNNKKTILIGLKEKPKFKEITSEEKITLGKENGIELTKDTDNNLKLNNKKITGLADGTVDENSTDAITGKQLNEYVKKDASNLDENGKNDNRNKWIEKLGTSDGNIKNEKELLTENSGKGRLITEQAFNNYMNNNKIKLSADNNNNYDLALGERIEFLTNKTGQAGTNPKTFDISNITYSTKNLATYIEEVADGNDKKKKQIFVGISEKPEFKEITLGEGTDTVKINVIKDATDENKKSLNLGNVKLKGLQNGKIDTTSSDAVTGQQLNNFAKTIEADGTNESDKLIKVTKVDDENGGKKYTLGINETNLINKLSNGANITTPNDSIPKLVTDKQVKEHTDELKLKYKANSDTDTNKQKTVKLTDGLDFTAGSNLKASIEDNGKVKYELNNTLTGITSISGGKDKDNDKSKIELTQNSIKFTQDNKTLTIEKDKQKLKLTGLNDNKIDDDNYGKDNSGIAATQKEVKDVLNKIKDTDKAIKDNQTIVYSDEEGNKLVKQNGKFYKLKDTGEADTTTEIEKDKVMLKAVDTEGNVKKPTILANIKNTLGENNYNVSKLIQEADTNKLSRAASLKDVQEIAKEGLTFGATFGSSKTDTSGNTFKKQLGETVTITASGAQIGQFEGDSKYTGSNLATYVKEVEKNGKKEKQIFIGMKEDSKFKSLTIGGTDFGKEQKEGKGTITADDKGLQLGHDKANITISKADGESGNNPKAKITGLKDNSIDDENYGKENSGTAATQKEVKDVLGKLKTVQNGTSGTVVYTDKNGKKLMKDTDGKFYEADESGKKKTNATEVKEEDVVLSTVSSDGSTTKPITLANIKSALGLENNNGTSEGDKANILSKLTSKIDNGNNKYTDRELNSAVTLRDLQFIARAGLRFEGNKGNTQKALGDTVKIVGGATLNEVKTQSNGGSMPPTETSDNGAKDFGERFNAENVVTMVEPDGTIKIGVKKELEKIKSLSSDGNGQKSKLSLDKDGVTFEVQKNGAQEGDKTHIGNNGITITKKGGNSDKPDLNIKSDSIDFANKKGKISGLEDLNDSSDGHMAANKNYVDKKAKEVEEKVEKIQKESDEKINKINENVDNLSKKVDNFNIKIKGNSKESTEDKTTKDTNNTITIKGTGTGADNKENFDKNYVSSNVATKVDNEGNVIVGIAKELKNIKSIEVEDLQNDSNGNMVTNKKYVDNRIQEVKDANPFEYEDDKKKVIKAKEKAVLSNIAEGKIEENSTDAINGGQLHTELAKKLNVDADNLSDKGITNLTTKLNEGSDISAPKNKLVTDKQVSDYLKDNYYDKPTIDKKIGSIDEKANLALGGVANAVAMANLVQVTGNSEYRHNLSAAYGYYGKSHALAIGFSGISRDNKFIYKLSGSVNSNHDLAFGIGAGIMLGEKNDYKERKNTILLEKELKKSNEKLQDLQKRYDEDKKEYTNKLKELEKKLELLMKKR